MDDHVIKHLEIVQSTITRMAGNSFLLKGWTITIAAALFALAAKDSDYSFALLAILPAISFWGLDAYYLRQERLFRALYDAVRSSTSNAPSVEPFSMSTTKYSNGVHGWFRTLFTPAVLPLHSIVLAAAVIVIFQLTN